jgi:hypothetical protein
MAEVEQKYKSKENRHNLQLSAVKEPFMAFILLFFWFVGREGCFVLFLRWGLTMPLRLISNSWAKMILPLQPHLSNWDYRHAQLARVLFKIDNG